MTTVETETYVSLQETQRYWSQRHALSLREGEVVSSKRWEKEQLKTSIVCSCCRWFFKNVSRNEAMRLLLAPGNTQGSFLIRESETTPGEVTRVGQMCYMSHEVQRKKKKPISCSPLLLCTFNFSFGPVFLQNKLAEVVKFLWFLNMAFCGVRCHIRGCGLQAELTNQFATTVKNKKKSPQKFRLIKQNFNVRKYD